jgi:hypothetical protein
MAVYISYFAAVAKQQSYMPQYSMWVEHNVVRSELLSLSCNQPNRGDIFPASHQTLCWRKLRVMRNALIAVMVIVMLRCGNMRVCEPKDRGHSANRYVTATGNYPSVIHHPLSMVLSEQTTSSQLLYMCPRMVKLKFQMQYSKLEYQNCLLIDSIYSLQGQRQHEPYWTLLSSSPLRFVSR